jgi:hypothetical protein
MVSFQVEGNDLSISRDILMPRFSSYVASPYCGNVPSKLSPSSLAQLGSSGENLSE